MERRRCSSATDRNGKRICRGMRILYVGCPSGEHFTIQPTPVKVFEIYRQGADGTILECEYAPKPDYPSHFSCRASDTVVAL